MQSVRSPHESPESDLKKSSASSPTTQEETEKDVNGTCHLDHGGSEISTSLIKCKLCLPNVSTDFKLRVLRWAYSKTIQSAGHHFNLDRCVVRWWMLHEEKIYKSASEEERKKWRNYESRVKKHFSEPEHFDLEDETQMMMDLDRLSF